MLELALIARTDCSLCCLFQTANRQYMIQTEVKLAKAMELQRFNPFSEDGKFENEAEQQLT